MHIQSIFAWGLTGITCLLALYAWAEPLNWQLTNTSRLQIFPFLGLLAFSIMWSHYAVATARRLMASKFDFKPYFRQSSWLVLALILAHPMLLVLDANVNNYELPDYAGQDNQRFLLLGVLALAIFLAYEVIERFKKIPKVQVNWPLVKAFNNAAFLAIFVHGLQLGQHLNDGWYLAVWWFYGASGLGFILHDMYRDFFTKKTKNSV